MTGYGSETMTKITETPNRIKTIDTINNFSNSDLFSQFRRETIRIRVNNKKDETTEYLLFSDLIDKKRRDGLLVIRDSDPTTKPSFVIEYPRNNLDEFYFIIRSYTERII